MFCFLRCIMFCFLHLIMFAITHLTLVNVLYGGFTPNCQVPALKASTSLEKDVTMFAFVKLTIVLLAKRNKGTCCQKKRHNKLRIILPSTTRPSYFKIYRSSADCDE